MPTHATSDLGIWLNGKFGLYLADLVTRSLRYVGDDSADLQYVPANRIIKVKIKKAPDFSEAFVLVAGTGLEPVTFGL